jgi:hypothetical protein
MLRHLDDIYCELMQMSAAAIRTSGEQAERFSGLHSGFSTQTY